MRKSYLLQGAYEMMCIANRAFFLNYILSHMEEYVLKIPCPNIITMYQRVMHDIYTESHYIHARALYYFFYGQKPQKDDIHCYRDYDYKPIGDFRTCKRAIIQINKSIAHITIKKGTNFPWGREVGIKLESLLVPEIQGFIQYVHSDAELSIWLSKFSEFNYESRIKEILKRCEAYPTIAIL